MLKCFRCGCKNYAAYECLKQDFVVYSCSEHVENEENCLSVDYNALHQAQIDGFKAMIEKKKRLLTVLKGLSHGRKVLSVKPLNPKNQFLMNGLVGLRSAAGQSQNRNQAHIFKLAIKALQRYPLPIVHPEQALDLQGLGPSSLPAVHKTFKKSGVFYKYLKKTEEKTEKRPEGITIKLYVDQRETRGNELIESIEKAGINVAVKTLALGDFIFVAEKGEKTWVLDLIIERKSSNDLNSSHFSNHLRDQIRRLKTSDCPLKILMVEGKANFSIISEIWVRHQLKIVNFATQQKAINFFLDFSQYFVKKFSSLEQLERLQDFADFQKKHSTGQTVGQVFYRQILEFPGISAKKLNLFISLYPTLIDFLKAYQESKQLVHQNLSWCGIGPKVELTIFKFFGMRVNYTLKT